MKTCITIKPDTELMKHWPIPYILLLLVLFGFSSAYAQEYRDVVFLKNGSVIKGFYDELYPADSLHMRLIDGGVFICSMNDVARIAKERSNVYLIDMSDDLKHLDIEWRHRGYRGSLENGYNTNTADKKLSVTGVYTVHGYQFNRFLFLGIGLGFQQVSYKDDDYTVYLNKNNIPVFGDFRFYFIPRSISPLVDIRGGYTISGFRGYYFNPNIGVDFSLSPRCGLYLLTGYFEQEYVTNDEKLKSKNVSFSIGFHF